MKKEFCMKNVCGLIVALVAAMYAGGCCRCGGEHDMPKVEPVEVAKFELVTPRARARLFGEAKVWDFAAGVPSGGKVLKYAVCDAQGLRATAPTNRDAALSIQSLSKISPKTDSGHLLRPGQDHSYSQEPHPKLRKKETMGPRTILHSRPKTVAPFSRK